MTLWSEIRSIRAMPRVVIDLMTPVAVASNDPFYARITREFLREANRRHRRIPLIRAMQFGVCLFDLRSGVYFDGIEASGRRNVRKARRLAYGFRPIDYNDHLDDIGAIRASTQVRQGVLPPGFADACPAPCRNPPSRDPTHAYPYFGVLRDQVLVAYAGVLIAGELAMVEHIYGHAAHHSDGVVPLLLTGMAEWIQTHHPAVRYYGYGTWFGASDTLRRFKKKFQFLPHRATWKA